MQQLPPLNALRAFEAAARHLSFKQAGEELHVTPGAVSRHVSNLENFLGIRLFVRNNRQVRLTRSGSLYLREVQDGLSRIAHATVALESRRNDRVLRLKLPPTFAVRWLVPRIGRFHGVHPEISVQVTTSHDLIDFEHDDVDAGVHYGTELGKDSAGALLFRETLVPICRADIIRGCMPQDLANFVLLHSFRRPDDWPRWFARAGAPGIAIKQTIIFENSSLTYQGALDGLGVALAQVAFITDELQTGRLKCPVSLRLEGSAGYFLSYPKERSRMPSLRAFHAWIADEAEATRRQMAAQCGES